MTTVSGPDALPGRMPRASYLVHSIDPHVLICHASGQCFVREDGAEWEGDGYHVTDDGHRKSWTYANLKID